MQRSFELTGPANVHVSIAGGAVDIETIDGYTAIAEVVDDEGNEPNGDVFIGLRETSGQPELTIEQQRGGFLRHFGGAPELLVRLKVPHHSRLRVTTASADVSARGAYSSGVVNTASGDVRIARVDGDLELRTANGDVEIEYVGGKLTASSASGDMRVWRASGQVAARTASGDLELREVEGAKIEANTASGDVRIRAAAHGSLAVNSASGDVSVGVRRGSRVWLDVRSLSGETESELEVGDEPIEGDGPMLEVRVMTMSGDVEIRRAETVMA